MLIWSSGLKLSVDWDQFFLIRTYQSVITKNLQLSIYKQFIMLSNKATICWQWSVTSALSFAMQCLRHCSLGKTSSILVLSRSMVKVCRAEAMIFVCRDTSSNLTRVNHANLHSKRQCWRHWSLLPNGCFIWKHH